MARRLWLYFVLLALMGWTAAAQGLAPGYVDPRPVLEAARKAIGNDNLKCVTISGTAYNGAVGQQKLTDKGVDWPHIDSLANYTRTMNWETKTMKEEFDRKPGLNPASWKYGLGWQDGTPVQRNLHQTFIVNGDYGWHMDGAGAPPVPMSPEEVERSQLEIWMNPHGFIKAARLPGANPRAVWRWEMGDMRRDGPTRVLAKLHVVSITLGKH